MEQIDDRDHLRLRDGTPTAPPCEPSPLAQAAFGAAPSKVAAERTIEPPSEGHEDYLARRRRERDDAIDGLVAAAGERGQSTARAFWAMVYDFELAPMTTNRTQLLRMGIVASPATELSDEVLASKLLEVVNGLARLDIYLTGTNHLSDRALYERLVGEVLDEEIRDVVGAPEVQEWIDMSSSGEADGASVASDRDERLPRPATYESLDA